MASILVARIRGKWPDTPILIMSAYFSEAAGQVSFGRKVGIHSKAHRFIGFTSNRTTPPSQSIWLLKSYHSGAMFPRYVGSNPELRMIIDLRIARSSDRFFDVRNGGGTYPACHSEKPCCFVRFAGDSH